MHFDLSMLLYKSTSLNICRCRSKFIYVNTDSFRNRELKLLMLRPRYRHDLGNHLVKTGEQGGHLMHTKF